MNKIKKLLASLAALVIAAGFAFSGGTTVLAQTVPNEATKDNTKGSITIQNAAKGETYSIYKLFDATVGKNGEVAYKSTEIPTSLQGYFEATSEGSGYVQAKKDAFESVTYYTDDSKTIEAAAGTTTDYWTGTGMSKGLRNALKTWAGSQTTATQSATSDGSTMEFVNLDFGYYVVTTTQGQQAISVDTTKPAATIYDKNTYTITATKSADKESYNIGDTITYTAEFNTKNYAANNGVIEQVKSYTIADTLPDFLSDVNITSLKIVQDNADKTHYPDIDLSSTYKAFTNKQIVIPWVDEAGTTNLYKNGSVIKLTYTAKLTDTVNINTANKNTVSITPNSDKDGNNHFPKPKDENWSNSAEIKTYGAAIKKVDEDGNALSGAKFTIKGLSVESVTNEPGVYKVTSYDPNSTTAGTEMSTNDSGMLYIIGLAKNDTLKVTESKAPDGYNKLTSTVDLNPQELTSALYETSGTRYYDADGNLLKVNVTGATTESVTKNYTDLDSGALKIKNNKGSLLPSTGGIGTTIFYIAGGILIIGAAVLLINRKKRENA